MLCFRQQIRQLWFTVIKGDDVNRGAGSSCYGDAGGGGSDGGASMLVAALQRF